MLQHVSVGRSSFPIYFCRILRKTQCVFVRVFSSLIWITKMWQKSASSPSQIISFVHSLFVCVSLFLKGLIFRFSTIQWHVAGFHFSARNHITICIWNWMHHMVRHHTFFHFAFHNVAMNLIASYLVTCPLQTIKRMYSRVVRSHSLRGSNAQQTDKVVSSHFMEAQNSEIVVSFLLFFNSE